MLFIQWLLNLGHTLAGSIMLKNYDVQSHYGVLERINWCTINDSVKIFTYCKLPCVWATLLLAWVSIFMLSSFGKVQSNCFSTPTQKTCSCLFTPILKYPCKSHFSPLSAVSLRLGGVCPKPRLTVRQVFEITTARVTRVLPTYSRCS